MTDQALNEGFIVEVGGGDGYHRIWYMQDPRVVDAFNAHDAKRLKPGEYVQRFPPGPQPREAAVFIAQAPKAMAPGDRVRVVGSMLLWYPNPRRPMTHGGTPVELPEGWHMAIEIAPGTVPIDPRGKEPVKGKVI